MEDNFAITERPTCLKEVFGNKDITTQLESMLKANSLPHTIMFTGSFGCGKSTLCNALITELNVMPTNVHYLDMGVYSTMEAIRDLIEQIKYIPLGGGKSIYIMEEVHKLSGSKKAQEGLLYTLEHLPEHVYIFATTTNPELLLPAFISRFEPLYVVNPLTKEEMLNLLRKVCKKHDVTIFKSMAEAIYERSNGCPRVALRLLYSISKMKPEEQILPEEGEFEDTPEIIEIYKELIENSSITKFELYKKTLKSLESLSKDWEANRQALLAVAGNYHMRSNNIRSFDKGASFILTMSIPCSFNGFAMFSAQLWNYISNK